MLETGTRIGRYEIRSKIGKGGMGEVYLAQDMKLDRKVAVKTLPAELAATNFSSERIFALALSRDGKQVAMSRGNSTSDVVLISNFKR